jgi:pimeloyl-ACP methyl ester carboxylesterase
MPTIGSTALNRRQTLAMLGVASFGACGQSRLALAAPVTNKSLGLSEFVLLGGLRQWISIRDDDARNPVLLVVHGGPGESQWPVMDHYRAWEKHFTVVQWDQRGAGHSYGLYGADTPEMTLDRIAGDGAELMAYLCKALGKRRIIVLGHSWGSTVGVTMVQRQPKLVAAYVGTGQVGSWQGALKAKFELVLARSDAATAKELRESGPPDVKDGMKVLAFNDRVHPYWSPADVAWIKSLRANGPAIEAADPKSYKHFVDGFTFSAKSLLPEQMKIDLPATASRIGTAFFVIQGRDDMITLTRDAIAYFDGVKAPVKRLILIPDAGHFAFMTAPDAFLRALVETVRPVAIARGA